MLVLLDDMEDLLSEKVLNYAVRGAGWAMLGVMSVM